MVVFDSSILVLVLNPSAKAPPARRTKQVISHPAERIDGLVQALSKDHDTIAIPAPALAEVLAGAADALTAYQEILNRSRFIEILPFDQKAAVESAVLFGIGNKRGLKKNKAKGAWQKVKVDQQIVAIAIAHRADVVYTCDDGLEDLCKQLGMKVMRLEDIPIPKDAMQTELALENAASGENPALSPATASVPQSSPEQKVSEASEDT
jgi:predicted nucleic acid-binding protein